MSTKFGAKMFERVKEALNKQSGGGGGQFANVMKFPAGHTYVLRLLPVLEEGKDPLFHHYVNGWTSKATGSFTSALSLRTFNEKDPISNLRWKLWRDWKDANPNADNKDYAADIKESENWFINVYVIDDPSNSENNGTVKILKMGPQLKEKVDAATEGDRADELGWEIFDPTAGHDLKIVAAKQGIYTTFKDSFFTTKSKTTLTESDVEKIYESLHDLNQVYSVKTYEELETLLNEHYFCDQKVEVAAKEERKATPKKAVVEDDDDDEIPMVHKTDKKTTVSKKEEVQDDVDELLAGLDLE
jgi:hypothetical protein